MEAVIPAEKLKDISWHVDQRARKKGEPGISHSYMASLATALNYIGDDVEPAWLMGTSAFAFRIFVNEVMCPSAMSIFDWSKILPEAVEQAGRHCVYVSRMWDEDKREEQKRQQAHEQIVGAIDGGVPAIVWDIADAEWGLITGYDLKRQSYDTLTCRGKPSSLNFRKLGRNGIDVLSVAIPGEPNQRSRDELIINSLTAAVAHADQKEWVDRPRYQNGLPAYDLWALLLDRRAMIAGAGRSGRIPSDLPAFAAYHARIQYPARCYARDYLGAIANGNAALLKAAASYGEVASCLKPVWDCFSAKKEPGSDTLSSLAENVRDAKTAEEKGINSLKEYLRSFSGSRRT